MGIYSANRSGSMSVSHLTANESYKSSDLGRIMYESAVNDQILFESIIANDFREIRNIKEGTLLESEIRSLNEASVKELFKKLKDKIMAFFRKIKGAIKSTINKISAYLFKDGKAFAKRYREFESKHRKADVKITEMKGKVPNPNFDIDTPNIDNLKKVIRDNKNHTKIDTNDIIGAELGKLIHVNGREAASMGPADFRKYAIEKAFIDGSTSNSRTVIEFCLELLENQKTTIEELKKQEKAAEKAVRDLGNELKAAERDAATDDNDHSEIIRNITSLVSATETIITTSTSTVIQILKLYVSTATKFLSAVMKQMKKAPDKAVDEAAMDAEIVDSELESMPDDEPDAETQEAIDDVVDEIEV